MLFACYIVIMVSYRAACWECYWPLMMMIMVRLSHCWPGRALWSPGVEAPRIPRQSIHEGGEVSATHRPSLPLGDISGTHFC
jgi:hypothetical protein